MPTRLNSRIIGSVTLPSVPALVVDTEVRNHDGAMNTKGYYEFALSDQVGLAGLINQL